MFPRQTSLTLQQLVDMLPTAGPCPYEGGECDCGLSGELPRCLILNEIGVALCTTEDKDEQRVAQEALVQHLTHESAYYRHPAFGWLKQAWELGDPLTAKTRLALQTFELEAENETIVERLRQQLVLM